MTQTKKEITKKEIKETIKAEYEKEKIQDYENYINNVIVIGKQEDYISKSIKSLAVDYMNTLDSIHNLSIDTTYNFLVNNEENIENEYYDNFIDDYLTELKELKKQNLESITDKAELQKLIKDLNTTYLNKFIYYIKQNGIDLYDNDVRNRQILQNAQRIVFLQQNEIKKYGYDLFLKADLKQLDRQFIFYMQVKQLIIVQNLLKEIKKDIHNFSIDDLIKETGIKDKDLIATLNILGVEKLGKLQDKEIKDIQDNVVENFLYILLLYQEITEHYIITNNILAGNINSFTKRHNKIIKIQKLVKEISKKYSDYWNILDEKEHPKDIDTESSLIISKMQQQDKNIEIAKLNTTYLSNNIFTGKDLEIGTPYSFSYKEHTTQEDITTSITIYDANSNIINLSKEHRDINDAVGSLLDNGRPYITLKQFYNFINKGIANNDPVEKEKLDELLAEIYKMDKKADIDATEQYKLKGYKKYLDEYEKKTGQKARPIISQNLINFKLAKVPYPNGEVVDVLIFLDYPAIYDYARQFRQLAPYPAEILKINYSPKGNNKNNTIKITDITKTIRTELIRCIELRKSQFNQPLVINNFLCINCQFFDVIEPIKKTDSKGKEIILAGKVLNKLKRARYTKNIEIILNNFKDKDYIKDYEINKQGRADKYSITFKFNGITKK